MLEKNRKKKVNKKKYPVRLYGYADRDIRRRVDVISKRIDKSISSLIREGLEMVCDKYEKK